MGHWAFQPPFHGFLHCSGLQLAQLPALDIQAAGEGSIGWRHQNVKNGLGKVTEKKKISQNGQNPIVHKSKMQATPGVNKPKPKHH